MLINFLNIFITHQFSIQHKVEVFHSSIDQNDYLHSAIQTVIQIHRLASLNEDILYLYF